MRVRGRGFEIDREERKFLGVCAGLSRMTGVDATIIRVGLVLVTLMGAFPWTVLAYFLAAFLGQPRQHRDYLMDRVEQRQRETIARDRMRDLDVRLQAIETYTTSANSRLAREIEELR